MASLEEWLRNLRLDEYYDKFKELGATSLSDLKDMRESDLDQLTNELDMRFVQKSKFKKAIAELNRSGGTPGKGGFRSSRASESKPRDDRRGGLSGMNDNMSRGGGSEQQNVIVLTEEERQAITDFGNKIEQVEGTLSRIDDHVLHLSTEAKRQTEKIKRAFSLLRRDIEARERELIQKVENDKSEKVGELTQQRSTLVAVLSTTKQSQQQAESMLRGAVNFSSMEERADRVLDMADKTKRSVERALSSMSEVDTRILPSLSLDSSDQVTSIIKRFGDPGMGRYEMRPTLAGSDIDDMASHVAPSVMAFRYNASNPVTRGRDDDRTGQFAPPETGTRVSSAPGMRGKQKQKQDDRSYASTGELRPGHRRQRSRDKKKVDAKRFPTAVPSEIGGQSHISAGTDRSSRLGGGGAVKNNFRRGNRREKGDF